MCHGVAHKAPPNVLWEHSLKESDRHHSFIIASSVCLSFFVFHVLLIRTMLHKPHVHDTNPIKEKRNSINSRAMLLC